MGLLDGKSCVVTGAASGIGRATAKLMAAEGASVVVADINGAGAREVAGEITAAGDSAVACTVDVSDEEQVRGMIECAVREFGRLDALYNNAASVPPNVLETDGEFTEVTLETIHKVLAVDLIGVILGCKHAIPAMIAGGGGSIISITVPDTATYKFMTIHAVAKRGIIPVVKSIAASYGKQNIRSNAVAPGMMLTPLADQVMPADVRERMLYHNCLPRLGRPEDMANMVVYLASDRSSFVTGQVITVDGGFSSHSPDLADRLLRAGVSPRG